jgi:hypothetical protein
LADVFISYRRDNQAAVQRLVEALRAEGVKVWWDQDIAVHAPWEDTIEHELATAKALIVAWSPSAVVSENVRAEARRAKQGGKLVQAFLERCDPPLFFGERQGVSLVGWKGDRADPNFQKLVAAVRALVAGKAPPQDVGHTPHPARRWRLAGAGGAVIAVVAIGVMANVGGSRDGLCRMTAGEAACRPAPVSQTGAPDPAALATRARANLIRGVTGAWSRQEGSCAEAITIKAATDPSGVSRLTVTTAKGFASTGQVIAADNGEIVTRDTTPSAAGGREQWEYRPSGDAMTVTDKNGVTTTLVRCQSHS